MSDLRPVPDPERKPPPNLLASFTCLAVLLAFAFVWSDVLLGGVSTAAYVAQAATILGVLLLGLLADKVQRRG